MWDTDLVDELEANLLHERDKLVDIFEPTGNLCDLQRATASYGQIERMKSKSESSVRGLQDAPCLADTREPIGVHEAECANTHSHHCTVVRILSARERYSRACIRRNNERAIRHQIERQHAVALGCERLRDRSFTTAKVSDD